MIEPAWADQHSWSECRIVSAVVRGDWTDVGPPAS